MKNQWQIVLDCVAGFGGRSELNDLLSEETRRKQATGNLEARFACRRLTRSYPG